MKNCSCHTAIQRDGSGRLSRFLKALDPSYNPIDDRNLKDLLVFAKRFANQIRFFKTPDEAFIEDKSWKSFFKNDLAVLVASISVVDLQQIEKDYLETRNSFDKNPTLDAFKAMFLPILGIASRVDKWLVTCSTDFRLYQDIQLIIRSSLRIQILKVFELDKSAMVVNNSNDLGLEFDPKNEALWDLDVNIPLSMDLYKGADLKEQLHHASLEIDTIFNTCLQAITQIVDASDVYFELAIEKYPRHQPHIALYITFLELFSIAQKQLNTLTEKHLNFYYRDVLNLKEKPAQPDHVNLIFELAQDANTCFLPKGTPLLAGNDKSGIEQTYITDREIVLNKAKIKEIRSVYIDKCGTRIKGIYARPIANSADGFGKEFKDAEGKWHPFGMDALKHQNGCGTIIKHQAANSAKFGFAIASPQLRLEGGQRAIRLKVKGISEVLKSERHFSVRLSNEKGWTENLQILKNEDITTVLAPMKPVIPPAAEAGFVESAAAMMVVAPKALPTEPSYGIKGDEIIVFLPETSAAIKGYDPAIHTDFYYPTKLPVLQILLENDVFPLENDVFENCKLSFGSTSKTINNQTTTEKDFELEVSVENYKKVIIKNEQGLQQAGTPFFPFTQMPTPGSPLYVGSEEVFNKKLDMLSVNIGWQNAKPSAFSTVKFEILQNKVWEDSIDNNNRFANKLQTRDASQNITDFSNDLNKGFVKIDFSNANYKFEPAEVMKVGTQSKVNEISLSYQSNITQLDENFDQFFHIYPFGAVETSYNEDKADAEVFTSKLNLSFENNKTPNSNKLWANNRVFPDFKYGFAVPILDSLQTDTVNKLAWKSTNIDKTFSISAEKSSKNTDFSLDNIKTTNTTQYSGAIRQEGNLFIGIEGLIPPQNLSLLFQIADGSALDDDIDPPKINWAFLSNGKHIPLSESSILMDSTYGFQTTGIVVLDIPKEATDTNTSLTNGLHWLVASVDSGSHRIPYFIKIIAQAIPATFRDQNNAPEHYDSPLPAMSIAKMLIKPNEIKSVTQPFASYNGVPAEVGAEFYMRVSERLRHKNRAITAHDYEKLILEYFPSIFKVKAITYTDPNCLCRDSLKETDECNESRKTTENAKIVETNAINALRVDGQLVAVGIVLAEKVNTALPGVTVAIKGTNKGTTTDANGKFKIGQLNNTDTLVFSFIGYVPQEFKITENNDTIKINLKEDTATLPEVTVSTCCGPQIAPGHVLIVPIENLKNRNGINRLQPRTSYRVLREIETFLKKKTSPFVKIHARNPHYEEVLTAFRVKFHTGLDKGFYLKKLNEDIIQFLTPWVFDESVDMVFGGKIYASTVINFIERQPYVDFISDFMLYQIDCECCAIESIKGEITQISKRGEEIKGEIKKEKDSMVPPDTTDVKIIDVLKKLNAESHQDKFLSNDAAELWDFIKTESDTMLEWAIRNGLTWWEVATNPDLQTKANQYELQLVMKVIEWYINLVKSMGLKTVADLMKYLPVFKMATMIEPTNPRSLLVSASQHIIILYEEEIVVDPCKVNKSTNKALTEKI